MGGADLHRWRRDASAWPIDPTRPLPGEGDAPSSVGATRLVISAPLHLARLARVGFVLVREGVLSLVDPAALPPAARLPARLVRLLERRGARGQGLAPALARLGPSYVKFGQFAATRPDLVGIEVARALGALQDRMPPFPEAQARAAVGTALGRPVEALYESFGPAIAAASVAQVHRATVREGSGATRTVAVKVLRPGVRERFRADLDTMRFAARLIQRLSPASRRLKPLETVEILARSVVIELDLRLEAAALSELGENTARDEGFRVPTVDWERTARDLLTTEWIDAIPLTDPAAIVAARHDSVALGRLVLQSFLRHALRDGFFHADMHPGNLFVDGRGRLVAVDCGIMGRLGPPERRFLAEILHGFIKRDYGHVAQVHFDAGYVPKHHAVADFAQAIRAIGEPIHNRPASEISMARLLALLFDVTALFDMRTRTELVMLQKTMVVVEGVARGLDPRLDIWTSAEPVVREWITRHLGPVGVVEAGARGLADTGRMLAALPGLIERVEALVERTETTMRQGVRIAPESIEASGAPAASRGLRLLLPVGAFGLGALLVWLVSRS